MQTAGSAAAVTIDVAHPPLSSEEAERLLDEALRAASLSGRTRVIRVIHGYGSGGKGGTLRTTVRNWAFTRKAKLERAVPGEAYSAFDTEIQKLLVERGISLSWAGPPDPGWTLIFLR